MSSDMNAAGRRADSTPNDNESTDRGPQLSEIRLGDLAESWRAAGFHVSDNGACVIGRVAIHCLDTPRTGFVSWSFDRSQSATPSAATPGANIDGLSAANAQTSDEPPTEHPNGIISIDHVVISTGDCARTISALEEAGFPRRGGRTTTSYGSPTAQSFFWAGDVILELVGPGEGEPTTDDPALIFGLALVSHDIDATAQFLGGLMGEPKPAVQKGRRIAGLRHSQLGMSLPIAVMSRHQRG